MSVPPPPSGPPERPERSHGTEPGDFADLTDSTGLTAGSGAPTAPGERVADHTLVGRPVEVRSRWWRRRRRAVVLGAAFGGVLLLGGGVAAAVAFAPGGHPATAGAPISNTASAPASHPPRTATTTTTASATTSAPPATSGAAGSGADAPSLPVDAAPGACVGRADSGRFAVLPCGSAGSLFTVAATPPAAQCAAGYVLARGRHSYLCLTLDVADGDCLDGSSMKQPCPNPQAVTRVVQVQPGPKSAQSCVGVAGAGIATLTGAEPVKVACLGPKG